MLPQELSALQKNGFMLFTLSPIVIELPFIALYYYNMLPLSTVTYLFYFLSLSVLIIQSLKISYKEWKFRTKIIIGIGLIFTLIGELAVYVILAGMIEISKTGLTGIQ